MQLFRRKSFKFLCFLVMLVLAFLGGVLIVSNKYKLIDVPIAGGFLDKREVIKNKDIEYIKMPKVYVNEDVILDENELIGKYINNDYFVNAGSFFYRNFIDDEFSMNDIDYIKLDNNKTVYELFVKDASLNAAHLNKNMYVDLYLTIDKPNVMSDLLISGAKICGLYNNNYEDINKSDSKNNSLAIVSLVVDYDMVSLLNKGMLIGDISVIPCSNPYTERECMINGKGDIINYLN